MLLSASVVILNFKNRGFLSSLNDHKVGWCFNNTYSELPKFMFSFVPPEPAKLPKLIMVNNSLCKKLNLDFSSLKEKDVASILSGNSLPAGSKTISQAYAGHQFGFLTMLGDGRATMLGEHVVNKKKRFDCIMGLSGGLDSSYLALLLKKYDLRVLAVHVDAGWNTELAVSNIEMVVYASVGRPSAT